MVYILAKIKEKEETKNLTPSFSLFASIILSIKKSYYTGDWLSYKQLALTIIFR